MQKHQNDPLAQAMTLLIQNQAAFVAQLSHIRVESEARFARIERTLEEIKAVQAEHSRILRELLPELLAKLPEAVREKIGFKPR
jgi:hypothetical protein